MPPTTVTIRVLDLEPFKTLLSAALVVQLEAGRWCGPLPEPLEDALCHLDSALESVAAQANS